MTAGGLLLVDKPAGVTSHDVVQVVRRKLGLRRIGHGGTLDPMAEGLLVLLVGPATKRQQDVQKHEKTYEAVVQLGTQTETADATGRPIRTASIPPLDRAALTTLLTSLQGLHVQTPPQYSALKVQGKPAYWWARRHQAVALPQRRVRLTEVALISHDAATITCRVSCSAGTYVRALAETIAERLGTVGHLTKLVRLQVGDWSLAQAKSLDWIARSDPAEVAAALLPLDPSTRPAGSPGCVRDR